MMNIQGLMKQAQMMQKKMQEEQERLEKEEFEGVSGGGMVKVVLNGKLAMVRVMIDKSITEAEEVEGLEDLIVAAHNDAKATAEAKMNETMGAITGGLNLGGMKLPF